MDTRMVKDFRVSNKHYRGLSERWLVEVTYIGGGPRSRYEGTMEEVQAYMLRTLVKTGQPANDKPADDDLLEEYYRVGAPGSFQQWLDARSR
jgi:hypothetical protein